MLKTSYHCYIRLKLRITIASEGLACRGYIDLDLRFLDDEDNFGISNEF